MESKKMNLSALENKLNVSEMQEIMGGALNCAAVNSRGTAIVAFVCGIGTFTGVGAIIFGPTSIALGAAMIACAK